MLLCYNRIIGAFINLYLLYKYYIIQTVDVLLKEQQTFVKFTLYTFTTLLYIILLLIIIVYRDYIEKFDGRK